MAVKESSVSNIFNSFQLEYSSDDQSESSSKEVKSGEDESNRFSVTNWCQLAKFLTEIECVCCSEIETVTVLSGNFGHLSCFTDHSYFKAVCLNETMLTTT